MKKLFLLLLICSVSLALPLRAHAGDDLSLGKAVLESIEESQQPRKMFLEVGGGVAYAIDGDFTEETERATDFTVFDGVKDDIWLKDKSVKDIYGHMETYSLKLGTRVRDFRLYLRFAYTQGDAEENEFIGFVEDCPVTASFSDYQDFGLMAGFEYEMFERGRIHPYIGFEAGIRFVKGINADFHVDDPVTPMSFDGLAFYEDTFAFAAALVVGVRFDVTERFSMGVESGFRYQSPLDSSHGKLDPLGFEGSNDARANFISVPIMVTGTWEF